METSTDVIHKTEGSKSSHPVIIPGDDDNDSAKEVGSILAQAAAGIDPSAYYREFHSTMGSQDDSDEDEEEEEEEDERSERDMMRSSAPPSSSHRPSTRSPLCLPSIADSIGRDHHALPTSLTASHPPPPSASLFNPSIPFASSSMQGIEPSPSGNLLDSLSHENFQMTIVVQPPLKTVYQRILKPFPSICLNIIANGHPVPDDTICEGLFVEATLLRGDNGVPLPKCIDGNCVVRFERRSRSLNEGLFATFKKLKILSTSQQLQGTLLRLKFTLKKYSGNSFATIQVPNCSVISHPIEVFSHTQYLNKNKEMKAPTLPQPVLDYFAQAEERKSSWKTDSKGDEPVSKMSRSSSAITTTTTTATASPNHPALHPLSVSDKGIPNGATLIKSSGSVPPPLRPGQADSAMELVRVLHEFKAQGGSYQTALNWLNHVYSSGVPPPLGSGKLTHSGSGIPTSGFTSKGGGVGGVPPPPPLVAQPGPQSSHSSPKSGAPNLRGSSFLRSSFDNLATLRSSGGGRTSPIPSTAPSSVSSPSPSSSPSLKGSNSGIPLPNTNGSIAPPGAPASSRKRGSSLSTSSGSVPVLKRSGEGKQGNNLDWIGPGDLSGLEALAVTSTESLNASRGSSSDTAIEIQQDAELVSSLVTDLKNNTISWEKFKGTLYDSLGESKAQHILSTLPPEIRAQYDTTFSDGPTSHSAKAEKPLTRRSSKKQLVQSTDATTLPTTPRQRKRRGSNANQSAIPSSSASDGTVPPSPEKKQKLSTPQPGVTKARTTALPSSPPSQPAVVTQAPTSSSAGGNNNNHNNGAQPLPPEMLLAQLSTYRPSSGPASPPTSESAGGGNGGSGGTARPSSPPVVTLSPTPRSAADAAPPTNRWYWKNDDEWEPYSDDICRELERAYSLHTVCYIILENVPYKMDFRTMVQIRMDSSKRWRHIRRD